MIVRNMRWGYDGGGMACGPVEGSSIVELIVTHNDAVQFIVVSRMSEFENVYVSPFSLFDSLIYSNNDDVDFGMEVEKVEKICTEFYSHEIYEPHASMKKSKLYKAINLARLAMKKYYEMGLQSEEDELAKCKEFIEDYLDEDISKMKIPTVKYDEDED